MTIEEKAKAYDEALERASRLRVQNPFDTVSQMMEHVFPKLAESDDERIRRVIRGWIYTRPASFFDNGISKEEILTWLEKQGEKNTTKPMFAKGDWIVNNGHSYLIADIDYLDNRYLFEIGGYTHEQLNWEYIENVDGKYHKWTIQDAKDSDVLFQDLMYGKTFIFDGVNSDMSILYSFIISNDGKDVLPYHIGKPNTGIGTIEENKNIVHPATKEQRDFLFKKMHEVGYEWDVDKKEIKKIEQKPAWSEEDKVMLDEIIDFFENGTVKLQHDLSLYASWLKSLTGRYTWMPSDEQIVVLEHFVRSIGESGYASPYDNNTKLLYSLLNDLKKLRKK